MKKKKVLLVVDNPTRDLPGIVLLSIYLSNKGIKCYLLSMNLIYDSNGEEIWRINPDFILLNYMRINNQELIRKIINCNIQVGILDTEGGVLVSVDSYKQTFLRDINLAHKVAAYFSWGSVLGNYLVREKLLLPEQLRVTGSPRFDFYSSSFTGISLWETSEYFQNNNPIVLINSNFPIANPKFQTQDEEKAMLLNTFKISMEEVVGMIENQQKALEEFLNVTLKLSAQYPNINFLYRPHPFENENIYLKYFYGKTNVILSKEGPVQSQIEKSICIIHRSCSTAIEAQLIGKPAFSLKWVSCYKEQPLSEAVSIGCNNFSILTKQLDDLLAGKLIIPDDIQNSLANIGNDWFGGFDGLAHKRVGDGILEILGIEKMNYDEQKINNQYNAVVKTIFTKRIKGILFLLFNIQSNWSIKKYFKRETQVKDQAYYLSYKERISWIFILLLNTNRRKIFFGKNAWYKIQQQLWLKSAKYFDITHVSKIIEGVLLKMPSFGLVDVRHSIKELDYEIGIGDGNSIIIEKTKNDK